MKHTRTVLRIALPLVVVATGVLVSSQLAAMRPEVEPSTPEVIPPLVRVVPAETQDVRLSVRTHGTVVPRTQSRLTSEVSGRVIEVSPNLVNGGFFEEGDILARIDPTDYELILKDFEMQVARAERGVAQEEADAEQAIRDWKRMRGDEEAPPLVRREPQLAEARAALAAARAGYQKVQRDVERTRIIAPFPGRVRMENVEAGEYVQRGQELAQVYAVDSAEVRLPLPDAQLAYLDMPLSYRGETQTSGPKVTINAEFAGEPYVWEGQIVRTEGELDPLSRMVMAVASIPDPYGRQDDFSRPPLSVGLFVQATLSGRTVEDVIVLPRVALRGKDEVFLLTQESRLERRKVDVLKSERDAIILRSGVEPGERIIVSPLETAVDGMRLRVSEAAQ